MSSARGSSTQALEMESKRGRGYCVDDGAVVVAVVVDSVVIVIIIICV